MLKNIKITLVFLLLTNIALHAQQEREPLKNTLLWRISGNGLTRPSYLFATSHIICKEDADKVLTPAVRAAIGQCDETLFEINMDNSAEMVVATLRYGKMLDELTLNQLLSKKQLQTVLNYFKSHPETGIPQDEIMTMKPMLLQSAVSKNYLPCKNQSGMEEEILAIAKSFGKKIGGISSAKEQYGFLDSIPYKEQVQKLLLALRNMDNRTEQNNHFNRTNALYVNQKVIALDSLIGNTTENKFEQVMGEARNKLWIPRMQKKMGLGSLFMAVGFAHLFGKTGLIVLLREAGYKVEGVEN